ncbi:MAG: GlxA family transcriptional regulator, partial [Alphaproteobacteria bacterium]
MTHSPDQNTAKFVFVLLPQFSLIAFAAAIEPLRIANRMAGKAVYTWRLASENGETATCSNGTIINVNMGLEEVDRS